MTTADSAYFRFRVRGLVQGVGFRPFVWRLAHEAGLKGFVLNDAQGVLIELLVTQSQRTFFVERLRLECPPLARIDAIECEKIDGFSRAVGSDFEILSSTDGEVATGVVPDAATCETCIAEISDPSDRRLGYAFTNCTHCGPRMSIISAIPYDRSNTSMSAFAMCAACEAEYQTPSNRRFHAQPNACPVCGPNLWCETGGKKLDVDQPLQWVAEQFSSGAIIAIKGIGGFHLAVDARKADAVRRLRARKNRPHKPLALMARNLVQIGEYCSVSDSEEALLQGAAAPIVLLDRHADCALPEDLAPGQDRLGFMLPYSPVHHLLMPLLPGPIVLTSGNITGEPQVISNADARQKLGGIADGFLMHDRDIVNRLDDSVLRVSSAGPCVLRRARGLAPATLQLISRSEVSDRVLALGADLKSTICLLHGEEAVVSQHIGDLEDHRSFVEFEKTVGLYKQLYRFAPDLVAIDSHPDYFSSRLGKKIANAAGVRVVEVQHHHAHMAACLAETGVAPEDDRSLGIILDGTGFGPDGTIWGGELLLGGCTAVKRVGHLQPVTLPGGAAAVREPWRNLVAHLCAAFGPEHDQFLGGTDLGARLAAKNTPVLKRMILNGVNAPSTSSAGRVFDAVAAALGGCFDLQSFEGQAGSWLEALARPFLSFESGYPISVSRKAPFVLSWQPMWKALLGDLKAGVEPGRISARFHLGFAAALADAASLVASRYRVDRIVLSGGVMQNEGLVMSLRTALATCGIPVHCPREFPSNDGGVSLGQAVIAGCGRGNAILPVRS